jgi:hypothetical protein
LALATNGSIEKAYGPLVEVFRLSSSDLRTLSGTPEHDATDRVLGHHISGIERSFCTVDLEAGLGVGDGEGIVVLDQSPAREAHHAHYGVLKVTCGKALSPCKSGHFDDLILHDKAECIGIMDCDVEDHAATSLRPVNPPALQTRGQRDGVEDAYGKWLTDRPFCDQLAEGSMGHRIAQVMIGPQHDPGGMADHDHFLGVLQGQG